MKTSRLITLVLLGVSLTMTPVYAQRGGGGSRGGGHSSSSSSSVSRGGGGHSSSSRSSSSYSGSSRSSSSYSGSSRSSSSYSSSPSRSSASSSYSRSSSTNSSSRGNAVRSSESSTSRHSGVGRPSYSGSSRSEGYSSGRSGYSSSREGSVPSQIRSRASRSGVDGSRSAGVRERGSAASRGSVSGRGGVVGGQSATRGSDAVTTSGRPSGTPAQPNPPSGYGRLGHPGPMPPSHRHVHPAPYFWHPHHHCMVHCHRLYWDPFPPRLIVWPGFWGYCNSYWYDYHVTDVVVVRNYARETYNVDLITYAISGDYMYALVNDPDGHTYIQIYDQNDKLLAEQQVSRKYCKMEIDPENGGCWIMKKRDKDPLLFLYADDGQLLIYEADK